MKQNSGSKGFSEPPATSEILGLASVPPTHSARSTGMCGGGSPGPLLSLQAPGPCTGFRGLLWARIKSSRWFEHSWISNVTESVRGLPRVTGGRLQASGTRQHGWEEAGLLKWEYSIQGNSALNPRSWFLFFFFTKSKLLFLACVAQKQPAHSYLSYSGKSASSSLLGWPHATIAKVTKECCVLRERIVPFSPVTVM